MSIQTILILTETTFLERDYARFGVETLRKYFDVHILDCTPWLRPVFWEQNAYLSYACAGHQAIHSLADFQQATSLFGNQTVAIDYLFSGKPHCQLRNVLRRAGILRAVVFSSQLPDVRRSGIGAFRDLLRQIRDKVQLHYARTRCYLHPRFPLPGWVADIAIVSGLNNLKSVKAQCPNLIRAHAFDYDTYLTTSPSKSPEPAYAVFLDQNLVSHTDVLVTGRQHSVSSSRYFPALNHFFDHVEHATGMSVVIAAQPRAKYDTSGQRFRHRQVVFGKTAELVQGACMVFAHYSTAISFPVLWRKPIIFLTTEELTHSWLFPFIRAFQERLAAPLIDLDNFDPQYAFNQWRHVDTDAYENFEAMHIKIPNTPDRPIWEIVADELRNF